MLWPMAAGAGFLAEAPARLRRWRTLAGRQNAAAAAQLPRLLPSPAAATRPRRHYAQRRSSQAVSQQKFEREIEIDMADAFDRRGIDERWLEYRNIEKWRAPDSRRSNRHIANEKFR